jgi:hypothetical protein
VAVNGRRPILKYIRESSNYLCMYRNSPSPFPQPLFSTCSQLKLRGTSNPVVNLSGESHRRTTRRRRRTTHPRRANSNIIIPESIRITPIALPSKIHSRDLRLNRAARPLLRIRIWCRARRRQCRDRRTVQPCLHAAVRAQVVLETLPGAGGEGFRGGDAVGGEVGQCRVVGFAVVHEDFGLSAYAEVLFCALGRVGHRDEGDVGVG